MSWCSGEAFCRCQRQPPFIMSAYAQPAFGVSIARAQPAAPGRVFTLRDAAITKGIRGRAVAPDGLPSRSPGGMIPEISCRLSSRPPRSTNVARRNAANAAPAHCGSNVQFVELPEYLRRRGQPVFARICCRQCRPNSVHDATGGCRCQPADGIAANMMERLTVERQPAVSIYSQPGRALPDDQLAAAECWRAGDISLPFSAPTAADSSGSS